MPTPKYLDLISAVFVSTLLVSNIIASKIGVFGPLLLPVGVIIFPITYILGDVLTEVYGYASTRRVIWMGFLCNLIAVIAYAVAMEIPPAPFYADQAAFATIFSATPRLLVASFIAYLFGSFSNAYLLSKLKVKTEGRHLWFRTISSTIVGEGLDSLIFIIIAFYGVFQGAELLGLVLMQWLFKCSFEILITPLLYLVVSTLKKAEGIDHYDRDTKFHPFSY